MWYNPTKVNKQQRDLLLVLLLFYLFATKVYWPCAESDYIYANFTTLVHTNKKVARQHDGVIIYHNIQVL